MTTAVLADAAESPAALEALAAAGGRALVADLRALPGGPVDTGAGGGGPEADEVAACRHALASLAAFPVVVVALASGPPSPAGPVPGLRSVSGGPPACGSPPAPGRPSIPGSPTAPGRPPVPGPVSAPGAVSWASPVGEADVVVGDEGGAEAVARSVEDHPMAAVGLALHLRASEHLPVGAALVAESATYSLLQAGPEHRRWLAGRPHRGPRAGDDERVRAVRRGPTLTITLARPAARNAVDAAMQQALTDALAVAGPDVTEVVLRGEGPSFSAGGDLGEFGSLADPASAHLVRLARSPGRALARVAGRTTVVVHGACYGAGVELPAFASRVVARPGTTFTLPEVAMGLVPGAGGTVSLPRRIGRQRTAWLALTGHTLATDDALAWGLVDEVSDDKGAP